MWTQDVLDGGAIRKTDKCEKTKHPKILFRFLSRTILPQAIQHTVLPGIRRLLRSGRATQHTPVIINVSRGDRSSGLASLKITFKVEEGIEFDIGRAGPERRMGSAKVLVSPLSTAKETCYRLLGALSSTTVDN